MSKTPVVISLDVNVMVASHLSKVPFKATDAFTKKVTALSGAGEIAKTGVCAWLTAGSGVDAKRHTTANRIKFLLNHEYDEMASFMYSGCHKGAASPTVKTYRPSRMVKNSGAGRSPLLEMRLAVLTVAHSCVPCQKRDSNLEFDTKIG